MKQKINNLIPVAIRVLEEANTQTNITQNNGKEIPKQYNSYIASFGAAVNQSGLIAALAFFCNENANDEQDRHKLMAIIYKIMQDKDPDIPECDNLFHYVIALNSQQIHKAKEEIMTIAVALKLAIRTYKLV